MSWVVYCWIGVLIFDGENEQGGIFMDTFVVEHHFSPHDKNTTCSYSSNSPYDLVVFFPLCLFKAGAVSTLTATKRSQPKHHPDSWQGFQVKKKLYMS